MNEAHRPPFGRTDASLLPLDPDVARRKMLIQVEVSEDFERRLDNQGDVQREIDSDRWQWRWGSLEEVDRLQEVVEAVREVLKVAHDLDEYKAGDRWSFTGLDDYSLQRGAAYQRLERLVLAHDKRQENPLLAEPSNEGSPS